MRRVSLRVIALIVCLSSLPRLHERSNLRLTSAGSFLIGSTASRTRLLWSTHLLAQGAIP
jgi:hypothetical protein